MHPQKLTSYNRRKISHVGTSLGELEDQMCAFAPDQFDGSPDRVDALVYALTELFGKGAIAPAKAYFL